MNYTFKLKKEDNLYLREFIDELLRVYNSVTVSADEEFYYISITKLSIRIDEDGITLKDECINEGFI
jgi:hypothetical protein